MAEQLTDEVQTYLIERLASFVKPTELQKELKDLFGLEVSLARLNYYDPTKAQGRRELAPRWKELFRTARKTVLTDPDVAFGRLPQYRILRLQEIAETSKNPTTVMKALEQIAKETGGAFAPRPVQETGQDEETKSVVDLSRLSDDDLATMQNLVNKATINTGNPGGAGKA